MRAAEREHIKKAAKDRNYRTGEKDPPSMPFKSRAKKHTKAALSKAHQHMKEHMR
jgi:hypothetical protein